MGEHEDKVKGKAKEATGSVREKAGDMTGNEEMEAEGKAQKAEGKLEGLKGDAKGKTKEMVD